MLNLDLETLIQSYHKIFTMVKSNIKEKFTWKARGFKLHNNTPFLQVFFKVRFNSNLGDMALVGEGMQEEENFFDCFAKKLNFWQNFILFVVIFPFLNLNC
jgi:hypothetical protein